MLAMAPVQQGQWHHCDNGKDACAMTMVMMPSWQGWQHQLDNGNNNITTRATTLSQWWQRCLECKDTCTLMITTHCNEGDNASSTTAKKPLHDDGHSPIVTKMAETPSHQRWQWLHHDNGKDACNNKRANNGTGSAA
jgi:hypothetical protein